MKKIIIPFVLIALVCIGTALYLQWGSITARCEVRASQYLPYPAGVPDTPGLQGACRIASVSMTDWAPASLGCADNMTLDECLPWGKANSSWNTCAVASFHPGITCQQLHDVNTLSGRD